MRRKWSQPRARHRRLMYCTCSGCFVCLYLYLSFPQLVSVGNTVRAREVPLLTRLFHRQWTSLIASCRIHTCVSRISLCALDSATYWVVTPASYRGFRLVRFRLILLPRPRSSGIWQQPSLASLLIPSALTFNRILTRLRGISADLHRSLVGKPTRSPDCLLAISAFSTLAHTFTDAVCARRFRSPTADVEFSICDLARLLENR
ncbi:hypothetical protein BDV38DRAFT_70484 [Aspergillus pseudotamarii]|uniref:Uncharacterized protein n=1 Tax=Aspergillus pseudotamarii TaxID=132259 RepID=A0A5N6SX76_ASPPS|nr:uncharacterized protein BDV38DRAFT_70484 [Aspergillus pseudotamarii]KAE8138391.1 hypothetical protein BDV38DRAFT_70484 [Aspergillus pseudotamarii]